MATSAPEEDASFRLGELFDSYEDLELKLERFSKQSLVHYWRRDSRTVSSAHRKTTRPISERLKYYSVKYACIYGGKKFLPQGVGRRQSQSIRTDCPAHIMLIASKDGNKLEVTSVNNEHNHEISEELFKKLPQERKLCGEIKQEVEDLMQLHIDRKRLKEYVRLRTNKVLRSKDLVNIAAANKLKRDITPERAYQLLKRIHDLEKLQRRKGARRYSGESEDEIARTIKRIKEEQESPCGQDRLSAELEVNEVIKCEDAYGAHQLQQDEEEDEEEEEGVVDDIDNTQGQLLSAYTEGDLITATGEIVGDLVTEDGDPLAIVESTVNADDSLFVDETDFNNYCNNHLTRDAESPGTQESLDRRDAECARLEAEKREWSNHRSELEGRLERLEKALLREKTALGVSNEALAQLREKNSLLESSITKITAEKLSSGNESSINLKTADIKRLMNNTYRSLLAQFSGHESYEADHIKTTLADTIKKITFSALNDLRRDETEDENSESVSESVSIAGGTEVAAGAQELDAFAGTVGRTENDS